MTLRPLVVGEAPSRTSKAPLDGSSGRRLASLAGVPHGELAARFELANLLDRWPGRGSGSGAAFPSAEARAAAASMEVEGRKVVLLGKRVASAFGVVAGLLSVVRHRGGEVLVLPHPSGASRWWNSPGNRTLAEIAIRSFVGEGPGADRNAISGAGRWRFDGEVADAFDEMLGRSVPDYVGMRRVVTELARRFARPGSRIVDLGCSRGEAIADLVDSLDDRDLRFVGCEVSAPMRDAAIRRFAGRPNVEIVDVDLARAYPAGPPASVVLAVLVAQFVPIEHRHRLFRNARLNVEPTGAFLLVEKVIGSASEIDDVLVDVHHADKRRAGYTDEEVRRKRLALQGVMVPLTAEWNESMLRSAGFRSVECVWRRLNFAAWLALP